jgi:hypothetical protein
MSTSISTVPEYLEWKQAYMAAVLETDRTRVVSLIQDARSKFATRLDELAAESYSPTRSKPSRMLTICFRPCRAACRTGTISKTSLPHLNSTPHNALESLVAGRLRTLRLLVRFWGRTRG